MHTPSSKKDLFEAPDYYVVDDLLNDEQRLIRDSVRSWVKKELSPIIEEYAQKAEFPKHLIKGLDELIELGLIEQTNNEDGKQSYKILVNPFQD